MYVFFSRNLYLNMPRMQLHSTLQPWELRLTYLGNKLLTHFKIASALRRQYLRMLRKEQRRKQITVNFSNIPYQTKLGLVKSVGNDLLMQLSVASAFASAIADC